MNYEAIVEPGKDHKYINVIGEFFSDQLFVSQVELIPGDIIVRGDTDWFLIEGVKIQDKISHEYFGIIIKPNNYLEKYSIPKFT